MAKKNAFLIVLFVIVLIFQPAAIALERGTDDLHVRVIDSGVALACVITMPGSSKPLYLVYDAGNYAGGGSRTFDQVQDLIPLDSYVELMVLSHSDSDHLGAADEICDAYHVKKILRSGYQRSTSTWGAADAAIQLERQNEGAIDINLRYFEYPMGATYKFGEVYVTMVSGFHKPPVSWGSLDSSKERNAGSIVIRVLYKGKSILFCGNAVGRFDDDGPNMVRATEKFMVDNSSVITIDSDVIIAPHHGADNASSNPFIKKVSPEYVIFSAGHKHHHPTAAAAQRYIDNGVSTKKMFRTDFGDDEDQNEDENAESVEWAHGQIKGHKDKPGDDDIDIVIRKNGKIEVDYVTEANQIRHKEIN